MDETPELPYAIRASSRAGEERTRVLKHDDTFAVFDRFGDVRARGEQGLYHRGTRHLCCYELTLGGEAPLLLSSTVRDDNATFTADLTNPHTCCGGLDVPHGTLHVFRRKFLYDAVCYERIRITNYGLGRVELRLCLAFGADFVDVFEVRGMERDRRGTLRAPRATEDGLVLSYEGLDRVIRTTQVSTSPAPARNERSRLWFDLVLEPHGTTTVDVTIACAQGALVPRRRPFEQANEAAVADLAQRRPALCRIETNNPLFDQWIARSAADLELLVTRTPDGPYPYGGIPWYSTPFGRDGLLTALQCLWTGADLARGVLSFLAASQAREVDAASDAEPGRILHEAREGEMAALREIPFGRYYGSVDATPLFVLLAGATWARTDDTALVSGLWPAIERAMDWIERYGDADGDGFVEYARHSPDGLVQQGWKDSSDSVFHADGTLAEGPIALCEVQAYTYGAYRAAGAMARRLGHGDLADRWIRRGRDLKRRFDEAFWCDDLETYALALDGRKRPCRVSTSNAGHCLLTGLMPPGRARHLAATLLGERLFTGFGVRTLAEGEVRYDPMSYHNGSVWPHDNAIVAMGLARYGLKGEVCAILDGLFEASIYADLHRLPELFCGFERRRGEGPTRYPVACSPQAWASATVYALLQASLGVVVDARRRLLRLDRPVLPRAVDEVRIRELPVGPDASVDLALRRHGDDVAVAVLRRVGPASIVVVK